jgi:hypothetical protein
MASVSRMPGSWLREEEMDELFIPPLRLRRTEQAQPRTSTPYPIFPDPPENMVPPALRLRSHTPRRVQSSNPQEDPTRARSAMRIARVPNPSSPIRPDELFIPGLDLPRERYIRPMAPTRTPPAVLSDQMSSMRR